MRRLVAIAHFSPAAQKVKAYLPQSERTEAEMRADMADELREWLTALAEPEGSGRRRPRDVAFGLRIGTHTVREVMVLRTETLTIAFDVPPGRRHYASLCVRVFRVCLLSDEDA